MINDQLTMNNDQHMMKLNRCQWAEKSIFHKYHDLEWGVPVYDDVKQFEFLVLESAQAGLSWSTILNRREGYREAFAGFDPVKVARFGEADFDRLIQDTGIIRNKLKIRAAMSNAKIFLSIQKEFGTFDEYIWGFVGGKPIVNEWNSMAEIPATSKESDELSSDMKKRGFKFVGSTILYAHMQAVGMVNDHEIECFRYNQVREGINV